MMRSDESPAIGVAKTAELVEWWKRVMAVSETREAIEAMWLPRFEATKIWGSKFFDRQLKPLARACSDVALEVRLVCEPHEDPTRAWTEVRTNLALFPLTSNARGLKKVLAVIASAQRELAGRWGLRFPEAGTVKPHVLTNDPRRLLRAYGKGNVFETQEVVRPLYQAYWFLADVWRAALIDRDAVTISRVRRIVEDAIAEENMDMRHLFAPPSGRADVQDGRPALTDELLARVGVALGCRLGPDGRYASPLAPIVIEKDPPAAVVRLVAEDLAARRGVKADSLYRKALQPIEAGELNGVVLGYTEAEAAAVRGALRKSQAQLRGSPED